MSPETQQQRLSLLPAAFQQGPQLLPSAQEGGDTVVPVKTCWLHSVSRTLTCRVVLVVCDKLWDAVEEVFFCQVILILGGAADDIVADHALGVSGEGQQVSAMGRRGRE